MQLEGLQLGEGGPGQILEEGILHAGSRRRLYRFELELETSNFLLPYNTLALSEILLQVPSQPVAMCNFNLQIIIVGHRYF